MLSSSNKQQSPLMSLSQISTNDYEHFNLHKKNLKI